MTRALRLVDQYWFDAGGRRVDWYAERGNFASWAVARAAGFEFLTTLPEHVAHGDGGLVDAWFATIGRDDPMEPRTAWISRIAASPRFTMAIRWNIGGPPGVRCACRLVLVVSGEVVAAGPRACHQLVVTRE